MEQEFIEDSGAELRRHLVRVTKCSAHNISGVTEITLFCDEPYYKGGLK